MNTGIDRSARDSAGFPEWMTSLAVVILFATLGLGGFFWWPLFVGAVLIVCIASYWYYLSIRKGQ